VLWSHRWSESGGKQAREGEDSEGRTQAKQLGRESDKRRTKKETQVTKAAHRRESNSRLDTAPVSGRAEDNRDDRIAEPTLPARTVLLTPRLIVRESCGAYLPRKGK
jgi:hypothetical protein